MAENTQDAVLGYIDAVKWIVGISGAVIAGVFLHPEAAAKLSQGARYCLGAMLLLFGISSFGGVVYLLWLVRVRRRNELVMEIESKLAAPVVFSDPHEIEELQKKMKRLRDEPAKTQKHVDQWYTLFFGTFSVAAILGVGLLFFWIVRAKDPVAVVPLHFTVVQSAVHRTDHGMQAHTFLLNQQTGEMWQMVCDQKGEVVAFRRVKPLEAEDGAMPVAVK